MMAVKISIKIVQVTFHLSDIYGNIYFLEPDMNRNGVYVFKWVFFHDTFRAVVDPLLLSLKIKIGIFLLEQVLELDITGDC